MFDVIDDFLSFFNESMSCNTCRSVATERILIYKKERAGHCMRAVKLMMVAKVPSPSQKTVCGRTEVVWLPVVSLRTSACFSCNIFSVLKINETYFKREREKGLKS